MSENKHLGSSFDEYRNESMVALADLLVKYESALRTIYEDTYTPSLRRLAREIKVSPAQLEAKNVIKWWSDK
jgi:hypothetical protein